MRKVIFISIFLFTQSNLLGQAFNWDWAYNFGADSLDEVTDVYFDTWGNLYYCGTFHGMVDFDPDPSIPYYRYANDPVGSIFLARINFPFGFQWAIQWDPLLLLEDSPFTLQQASNGDILITGYFTGIMDFYPGQYTYTGNAGSSIQYFIIRINGAGGFEWFRVFGGVNDTPQCYITVNDNNEIFIAGHFSDTRDFDPGVGTFYMTATGRDAFIMKLDASGNFLWAEQTEGNMNTWLNGIVLDESDNIVITGSFSGNTDFDPGVSNFTMTSGTSFGDEDVYIAKYSSTGNFMWAGQFSGTNYNRPVEILTDASNNIIAAGNFYPPVDFDPGSATYMLTTGNGFISKLDSSGNLIFAKSIGGTNSIATLGCAEIDMDKHIYFAGSFNDTVDVNPDTVAVNNIVCDSLGVGIFLAEWDSSGLYMNSESYGGIFHSGIQRNKVNTLFADVVNNTIYMGGRFEDPNLTFGNNFIVNATPWTLNLTDGFIAKIGNSTGIQEVSFDPDLEIYPNPSNDVFYLDNTQFDFLEIYDMKGSMIINRELSRGRLEIDLKSFHAGMYFLRLQKENGESVSRRIVKY